MEAAAARLAARAAGGLPASVALAFGAAAGGGYARLDTRRRRLAATNLRLVYPDKSDAERTELLRANFAELGRCASEWARLPHWTADDVDAHVEIRGLEHLETALAEGSGALVATAHYGYWEIILRAIAVRLAGYEVTAVGRDQLNPYLRAMVRERRSLDASPPIAQDARSILRGLRRNAAIGVLVDHYLSQRRGGVLADFLGIPAWSNPGPSTLALRTGSPIVVAHAHRTGERTHRVEIEPPTPFPFSGTRKGRIVEMTRRINESVGRIVLRDPTQWLWANRRWRGSPGLPDALYESHRKSRRA